MAQPAKGTLETILLVEDDPAILKIVKLILEEAGFGVLPIKQDSSRKAFPEPFIFCCRM